MEPGWVTITLLGRDTCYTAVVIRFTVETSGITRFHTRNESAAADAGNANKNHLM